MKKTIISLLSLSPPSRLYLCSLRRFKSDNAFYASLGRSRLNVELKREVVTRDVEEGDGVVCGRVERVVVRVYKVTNDQGVRQAGGRMYKIK